MRPSKIKFTSSLEGHRTEKPGWSRRGPRLKASDHKHTVPDYHLAGSHVNNEEIPKAALAPHQLGSPRQSTEIPYTTAFPSFYGGIGTNGWNSGLIGLVGSGQTVKASSLQSLRMLHTMISASS